MEDLTGKPAVLYSQTSFNCVDFRLRSAEHSSELDALLSLARKFAPFGVARDYLRNRVAIVLRNKIAIVYAPWAPMRILMIKTRWRTGDYLCAPIWIMLIALAGRRVASVWRED